MTEEEFQILTIRSEGECIDFKKEQYELIKSTEDNKAKFIKDIISFTNTIRKEPAYIIIGIEDNSSTKTFHGLNKKIDEAILQDQLKTRVFPIPVFSYYIQTFQGKEYGVIEIPLKRYPEPIAPVVKMKGLEPGKIYIRRGSTNSEAVGKEILLIDKWIRSVKVEHDIKSQIDEIIKQTNSGQFKLSYQISNALEITNHIQDNELIRFCKGELTGWYANNVELDDGNLPNHRKTSAMVSIYQVTSVTKYEGQSYSLKSELKKDDRFREINFVIQESITEIEATLDKGIIGYMTTERKMEDLFPNAKGSKSPVFLYIDIDDYKSVYEKVKTELIRLLIKIKS